jgi:hypothetical protein
MAKPGAAPSSLCPGPAGAVDLPSRFPCFTYSLSRLCFGHARRFSRPFCCFSPRAVMGDERVQQIGAHVFAPGEPFEIVRHHERGAIQCTVYRLLWCTPQVLGFVNTGLGIWPDDAAVTHCEVRGGTVPCRVEPCRRVLAETLSPPLTVPFLPPPQGDALDGPAQISVAGCAPSAETFVSLRLVRSFPQTASHPRLHSRGVPHKHHAVSELGRAVRLREGTRARRHRRRGAATPAAGGCGTAAPCV